MKIVVTQDGFIQVRYDSTASETKPVLGSAVSVYDERLKGVFEREITVGSEAFDVATKKVYVMTASTGWSEV